MISGTFFSFFGDQVKLPQRMRSSAMSGSAFALVSAIRASADSARALPEKNEQDERYARDEQLPGGQLPALHAPLVKAERKRGQGEQRCQRVKPGRAFPHQIRSSRSRVYCDGL